MEYFRHKMQTTILINKEGFLKAGLSAHARVNKKLDAIEVTNKLSP